MLRGRPKIDRANSRLEVDEVVRSKALAELLLVGAGVDGDDIVAHAETDKGAKILSISDVHSPTGTRGDDRDPLPGILDGEVAEATTGASDDDGLAGRQMGCLERLVDSLDGRPRAGVRNVAPLGKT